MTATEKPVDASTPPVLKKDWRFYAGITAIVLAAGRSQRMGTQKLLLPFAGQTVIGQIVDQILEGDVIERVEIVPGP